MFQILPMTREEKIKKGDNIIKQFFDKRCAKKLIKRLHTIDKSEWMRISHTFNGWEFPREFYDLIPKWWAKNHPIERASRVIRPIMQEVDKAFSEKEQLRYHNVSFNIKMSDAEFEYWYSLKILDKRDKYYNNKFKADELKIAIHEIQWWTEDGYKLVISLHNLINVESKVL